MLDLIGNDDDYDDGGGDGGDDDDGGLVQIGASKAQRAAAPGATSPNLNSTNATRIIINFFCCNKLCFFQGIRLLAQWSEVQRKRVANKKYETAKEVI